MVVEKSPDASEIGMDMVCRFAGHLAHDLNNLLTPIIACGQMLREGVNKNDPLYFCAEQIADAGDRFLELSRKLQIIGSRRSSGQLMDMSALLQEALRVIKLPDAPAVRLDDRGVTSATSDGHVVKIDMEQFFFLVQEMISNAVAAMPNGGTIRVGLSSASPSSDDAASQPPHGWVCLTIADQGSGMTPDVMAKMYEPFFHTSAQERDKGLGLTLVYGIVRRSGGVIQCESAPGAGTTFSMFFPRKKES